MLDRFPDSIKPMLKFVLRGNDYPLPDDWEFIDDLMAEHISKNQKGEVFASNVYTLSESTKDELLAHFLQGRTGGNQGSYGGGSNSGKGKSGNNNTKKGGNQSNGSNKNQEWSDKANRGVSNSKSGNKSGNTGGARKVIIRDRSTWRFPKRDDFCWYHKVFGVDAEKCSEPCAWDPSKSPRNKAKVTNVEAKSKPKSNPQGSKSSEGGNLNQTGTTST